MSATAAVLLLAACGASAPVSEGTSPPAAGPEIPADFFGLHYFFPSNPWPAVPSPAYRLWGTSTDWAFVHTAEGEYDWTQLDIFLDLARGRDVDLIFTFGRTPRWASSRPDEPTVDDQYGTGGAAPPREMRHWDDFVRAIATRNRERGGRIKFWEVWNEWDMPGHWTGDAATLVEMARRAHRIIKSIDPDARILSPSVSDYDDTVLADHLNRFLAAGGGAYVDVVAFHGYRFAAEEIVPTVDAVRAVMAAHGQEAKPLWDTEGGWGRNMDFPDPDAQVAYVARAYLLHWAKGVERFYWYGWDGYDPSVPDGKNDWGTLYDPRRGGIQRPGIAYREVYAWLIGAAMTSPCAAEADGTTWTCGLTRPGGYEALAVWNTAGDRSIQAPRRFVRYRTLEGEIVALLAGDSVPIGLAPILLETGSAS